MYFGKREGDIPDSERMKILRRGRGMPRICYRM